MKKKFAAAFCAMLVATLLVVATLPQTGSNQQHSPPVAEVTSQNEYIEQIKIDSNSSPAFEVARLIDTIDVSAQGDSGDFTATGRTYLTTNYVNTALEQVPIRA